MKFQDITSQFSQRDKDIIEYINFLSDLKDMTRKEKMVIAINNKIKELKSKLDI